MILYITNCKDSKITVYNLYEEKISCFNKHLIIFNKVNPPHIQQTLDDFKEKTKKEIKEETFRISPCHWQPASPTITLPGIPGSATSSHRLSKGCCC